MTGQRSRSYRSNQSAHVRRQRGALLLGRAATRGANPTIASAAGRRATLGDIAAPIMRTNRPRCSPKSTGGWSSSTLAPASASAIRRGTRACARYSASTGRRGVVEPGADAEARRALAPRTAGARVATRPRCSGSGAGEHAEQEIEIVGAARDRTEHVDVGVGACRRRRGRGSRAAGSTPKLGFSPNTPQQCDGMRTDPPMSVPSSKLVKPAATAAAEPPDEPPVVWPSVPRVVGAAEDLVEGLDVARPARRVGLAEHDRTRGLQPGDRGRVLRGDVVGQLDGAARGTDPLGLDRVLDGDRQAVERAELVATRAGRVGGVGRGSGALGVERDHRVDRRIQAARCGRGTARAAPGSSSSPVRRSFASCTADLVAVVSSTTAKSSSNGVV